MYNKSYTGTLSLPLLGYSIDRPSSQFPSFLLLSIEQNLQKQDDARRSWRHPEKCRRSRERTTHTVAEQPGIKLPTSGRSDQRRRPKFLPIPSIPGYKSIPSHLHASGSICTISNSNANTNPDNETRTRFERRHRGRGRMCCSFCGRIRRACW